MKGKLIYLMGSSGAGKDTVLSAIALRNLPNVRIAQRHITRPVTDDEAHHSVSDAEFAAHIANGDYAMHWQANGFSYAIPHQSIAARENGTHILLNGSRQYYPTAKDNFPELLGVCLLVDSDTLRQRLTARGRDSASEITARLERNEAYKNSLPNEVLRIHNDGQIEDTCLALLDCTGVNSTW